MGVNDVFLKKGGNGKRDLIYHPPAHNKFHSAWFMCCTHIQA